MCCTRAVCTEKKRIYLGLISFPFFYSFNTDQNLVVKGQKLPRCSIHENIKKSCFSITTNKALALTTPSQWQHREIGVQSKKRATKLNLDFRTTASNGHNKIIVFITEYMQALAKFLVVSHYFKSVSLWYTYT